MSTFDLIKQIETNIHINKQRIEQVQSLINKIDGVVND